MFNFKDCNRQVFLSMAICAAISKMLAHLLFQTGWNVGTHCFLLDDLLFCNV